MAASKLASYYDRRTCSKKLLPWVRKVPSSAIDIRNISCNSNHCDVTSVCGLSSQKLPGRFSYRLGTRHLWDTCICAYECGACSICMCVCVCVLVYIDEYWDVCGMYLGLYVLWWYACVQWTKMHTYFLYLFRSHIFTDSEICFYVQKCAFVASSH